MKLLRPFIVSVIFVLLFEFGFSQTGTIVGKVTDKLAALPGANLLVEGTTRGNVTNELGKFIIH